MSDTLPDSLLATCVRAVAARIGQRLPAAFDLDAGPVVLDGEAAAHRMPDDAVAVRWPLTGLDAALVVAIGADAAELLAGADDDPVVALTAEVAPLVPALAPLFDGVQPQLGDGLRVDADRALAEGPGDGVSVALDDAGTHRVTVGLRMVVADHLLLPADQQPQGRDTPVAGDQTAAAGRTTGAQLDDTAGRAPAADGLRLDARDHLTGPPATGIPLADQDEPAGDPRGGQPLDGGGWDPQGDRRAPITQPTGSGTRAHPAEFASFDQLTGLPGGVHPMAMLGEVEMGVTAELGRTRMTVRDVLGLNPGSIIELDRAAGSPVDVVVNGTLIARGEVVVIDEEFGIRITEIIGMAEPARPLSASQVAQ